MRTLFLLTMVLVGSSATAAPVPKEVKKQEVLVGLWKLESVSIGGKADTVGANDTDWIFDENFALGRTGKQKGPYVSTKLKIDPVTKDLDWPGPGLPYLGRYEISGDRLTICLSMPNIARPVDLKPNATNFVWVLRRAEK